MLTPSTLSLPFLFISFSCFHLITMINKHCQEGGSGGACSQSQAIAGRVLSCLKGESPKVLGSVAPSLVNPCSSLLWGSETKGTEQGCAATLRVGAVERASSPGQGTLRGTG